ncbi:glycosyltransferase [Sphingomonas sp. AR_OL41]|uniref:glycosyltransferase n=1 Tax=Sphingomonas sp. AR_OL41 TaxID=3042729 RepID=UPI002481134D|nr:glycosyltransferase [Sphingomonas sp. AR_OL41]MDH7972905.1 glycosyltransferase [Sphingomonas sp. AR_OL41]
MRIVHVTPYYLPAIRYGGPVRSVHALAAGAAALGHEVHVFTTDANGPNRLNVTEGQPVVLDGVYVHYFKLNWMSRFFYAPKMAAALAKAMGGTDMVHLHTVFLWPTLAAARIAAAHGVPYVLSPRGMLVKELVRKRSRLAKSAWITFFERRTIERAAAINVSSSTERAQLSAFDFHLPPVFQLSNGVGDPEPYAETAVSADVRAAVDSGNYVMFLGRLGWEKNLASLVRAMVHVPHIRLIIAGFDERGQAAALVSLIDELKLQTRISLLARDIEGADKEHLFARATLFCLPSFHENFGNVVLEAMMRGIPTLVGTDVGAADAVRAAGAGRVCDVTPAALAEALNQILANSQLLIEMGGKGRVAAERDYGWRSVAARSIDEYKSLVNTT